MRNWNASRYLVVYTLPYNAFWAYLWGIETTGDDLSFFIHVKVLSLPMRNWNTVILPLPLCIFPCFEPTYEELKHLHKQNIVGIAKKVLSLPMRNWNPSLPLSLSCIHNRFEPTYEELKLVMDTGSNDSTVGFEPTYEELKPIYSNKIFNFTFTFWAYLWGI